VRLKNRLTSFSPNENTGTRSALVNSRQKGWQNTNESRELPMLYRHFYEAQSAINISIMSDQAEENTPVRTFSSTSGHLSLGVRLGSVRLFSIHYSRVEEESHLGCSTHNNCDGLARPTLQDTGAGLFTDGADAHGQENIAIDGHTKVGGQRE
jgi:hypothetical protein